MEKYIDIWTKDLKATSDWVKNSFLGLKCSDTMLRSLSNALKGHIVTKKLTNVVMVTLDQIVKDQNAILTLNVTTVFVKMSKY